MIDYYNEHAAWQKTGLADGLTHAQVVEGRSELIDRANKRVSDLVDTAAKALDTLGTTTPDRDEILKSGTTAEVKAIQAAVQADDEFQAILKAYKRTWLQATSSRPSFQDQKSAWAGNYRPSPIGGLHCWERPLTIEDPDVRDGVRLGILDVAAHADAGFRLLDGPTISKLIQTTYVVQAPGRLGGRASLNVWLPDPKRQGETKTPKPRVRSVQGRAQPTARKGLDFDQVDAIERERQA